jgi:hypothetical protein
LNGKIVAVMAVAGAVAYFAITIAFLPQMFLPVLSPPRPAPAVTDISVSEEAVALGKSFVIEVAATNEGDHADRQIVSIAFPNATRAEVAEVLGHNFRQSPLVVQMGQQIGAGYAGPQRLVQAQYPIIEAYSSPWEGGESSSISLSVTPEQEGRFVVFVKAVGLPHNGDQAHWPSSGTLDQQDEYASVVEVDVTKA